jgi:ankyrin repeat protein
MILLFENINNYRILLLFLLIDYFQIIIMAATGEKNEGGAAVEVVFDKTPGRLEPENERRDLKYLSNNIDIFNFAFHGDVESVERLLDEKQESCLSEIKGYFGESLLTHAVGFSYNWRMVEFLIKRGADLHFVDDEGFTILMYSTLSIGKNKGLLSFENDSGTVKNLIKLGADFNAIDFKGRTFIDFLPSHKKEEMQEYINENYAVNLKPAKR